MDAPAIQMSARRVQGYIDPNFPNPMGPHDATIIIYGYTPSLALGIIAVLLFALAFLLHTYLLIRHKTWYFVPIAIGTAMEVVGYIFRILSSKLDPYSIIYFVVQYFFIVVAPVLFSASIYTILSVMINRIGREYAPLPPKIIIVVFVVCDFAATVIQITGSAMIGTAYSNGRDPSTPNDILLAGLAFQVFSFFIFIVCLGVFQWRSRHATSAAFKLFSLGVWTATLMIYLRTCFRLAETAQGLMQNLSTHEVFFGCLEFAPVAVATYVFVYLHPGKWLGLTREDGRVLKERL